MDPWELEAREAIRTLIARYAHCADRGHFEELAALFAEDGTLDIAGQEPLRGREAIRAFLDATRSGLATQSGQRFIRHHVSSVLIELQARDAATAASYFFVITECGPDHWGRYRDDLVYAGGRWLVRRRSVRVDGRWESKVGAR